MYFCLFAPAGANPGFSLIAHLTPAIYFLEQLLFGDCLLFIIKEYWRDVFNMRTFIIVALLLLVEDGITKEHEDKGVMATTKNSMHSGASFFVN